MKGRFDRLIAALEAGKSMRAFARSEGIAAQTVYNWLKARPHYAEQVAKFRRAGGSRKPVTDFEFRRRVEAYKLRLAGHCWKSAARTLEISDAALRQWCRINRAEIEAALAERRAA